MIIIIVIKTASYVLALILKEHKTTVDNALFTEKLITYSSIRNKHGPDFTTNRHIVYFSKICQVTYVSFKRAIHLPSKFDSAYCQSNLVQMIILCMCLDLETIY